MPTSSKKGKPKAKKAEEKPKNNKAPMSVSSAGATARMGIKQYVRFRPGHQWALPLASPEDRKTLGEWDAWYKAVLSSPVK